MTSAGQPPPATSNDLLVTSDPKTVDDLSNFVSTLLGQMQDKFQHMSEGVISRLDEMGAKIDDLEKKIDELATTAASDIDPASSSVDSVQKSSTPES